MSRDCIVFTAVVPGEEEDPANSTGAIAAQLVEALETLGWRAIHRKFDGDLQPLFDELRTRPPGFIFNMVESYLATDRLAFIASSIYESAGVPFAGSGSYGLFAGTDKLVAKRILAGAGIATPGYGEGPDWRAIDPARTYIVKAVAEHASFGLDAGAVVPGPEVRARADYMWATHKAKVFAEEFIEGREFNIAIIENDTGPRVLPLAEMDFTGYPEGRAKIIDYAAKWREDSQEYRSTNRRFIDEADEPELAQRLRSAALKVWDLFDLGGWARVDFRVDSTGIPYVIDVNVNPDISYDAGLASAALKVGISYPALIDGIVRAGLKRAGQ